MYIGYLHLRHDVICSVFTRRGGIRVMVCAVHDAFLYDTVLVERLDVLGLVTFVWSVCV